LLERGSPLAKFDPPSGTTRGVATSPGQTDLYSRALGALRGRYVLVIVLGLCFGAAAGYAGRKMGKITFQSEGLIRIAYATPVAMKTTDVNQPMPMYDAFMRSQQLLMQSRRIVDVALQRPEWVATGKGDSLAVVAKFANNLKVEQPRGTEHLRVTFTDEDPKIAAAAVNAIIGAYTNDYKSADAELQQKRINLLSELEGEHDRMLTDLSKRLAALKGEGAVDIEQLHAAAVLRLGQYESRLSDVELGLALSQSQGKGPAETSKTTKMLTARQIGMIDGTMRGLLAEQTRLEGELDQMSLRLGSAHSSVIALRKALELARGRVEQYAQDFRDFQAQAAQKSDGAQPSMLSVFVEPIESLQAKREVLMKMVDAARQEISGLAAKRDEAETLKAQVVKTRQALSEVQDRKAMLSLELALGDRLEVTSRGEVPLVPYLDNRMKFAAAGGLAGACLPAMLIALLGLVNRRYRFSDEAVGERIGDQSLPLLGVLPVLPDRLTDPDRAADAAQCVHQIRVILQSSEEVGTKTYLVSSASSQEGKTSLCVALGLSFAASGSRTLLIDADLVGRGLTRGLRADGLPGFREALETGQLSVRSRPDGLSVLTAGDASANDACKVSTAALRRLLNEARRHFDTILIDSGPILGSVEASVVSREVDGVIFAIARGQDPSVVSRSLRHFEYVGARVIGAVFNRAKVTDFYRSFQSSSLRPSSSPGTSRREAPLGFDDSTLFGPVVGSVAATLPSPAR
jgi:Mrp family chromosome partitioning ATPase/uncharacterized protein involved in exopolysaccharide biosynthesis